MPNRKLLYFCECFGRNYISELNLEIFCGRERKIGFDLRLVQLIYDPRSIDDKSLIHKEIVSSGSLPVFLIAIATNIDPGKIKSVEQ